MSQHLHTDRDKIEAIANHIHLDVGHILINSVSANALVNDVCPECLHRTLGEHLAAFCLTEYAKTVGIEEAVRFFTHNLKVRIAQNLQALAEPGSEAVH